MIDMVSCIAKFFNYSPKRQLCLDKWITDTLPTEEKRRKLKELCKTRWVERYDSYEVFIDLFVPIACCLEEIANSSNAIGHARTMMGRAILTCTQSLSSIAYPTNNCLPVYKKYLSNLSANLRVPARFSAEC